MAPAPPADAEIRANPAGAAWLEQLVAFGVAVSALLEGAREACPESGAPDEAGGARP